MLYDWVPLIWMALCAWSKMSYNDILLLVDLGNRKMTCRFALLFRQFNLNKVDVCIYFLQVATTKIYCTLYQILGSFKIIA